MPFIAEYLLFLTRRDKAELRKLHFEDPEKARVAMIEFGLDVDQQNIVIAAYESQDSGNLNTRIDDELRGAEVVQVDVPDPVPGFSLRVSSDIRIPTPIEPPAPTEPPERLK